MSAKKISLLGLLKEAFYVGAVGYGGPANLVRIKQTFVNEKEWISEKEFADAISLAQILPGSTLVEVMGYIGFKLFRVRGGILAPLAYILPAAIFMLILSWAYFSYGSVPLVRSLFAGLGALVVALLLNATWHLGKSAFNKSLFKNYKGLIISLAMFLGAFFLKINTLTLILASGILGFLIFYFTGEYEGEKAKKGEPLLAEPKIALRGKPDKNGWLLFLAVIVIIAAGLFIPLIRDLIISFVSVGLFAFGGGFTSIPLVQHQVIDLHNWLTMKQFMDGIALGQITPGPVLITATFVGYRVAGLLGALFATLSIFLVPILSMLALADIHAKVRDMKAVKVIVKGFLTGFIGLLAAITLQFALKSLVSWQAWLIFLAALLWISILKKDSIWAIIGTMVLSLAIF